MTNKLLTTVAAAALIAGAGFASAQDLKQNAPGAVAPAPAPQAAPAEKIGEPLKPSAQPNARPSTGQPSAQGQRPSTNAQGTPDTDAKQKGADTKTNQPSSNTPATAQTPSAAPKADTKTTTDTKTPSNATTGQGAASTGGNVSLTTEQRSKITTVFKEHKVAPITNVNFNISIGTRIPSAVRYHPLPAPVIAIYPTWRGFHYILVGNEILVIDPATREIVAILPA